ILKDINIGSDGSNPTGLTDVNGVLYFTATDYFTGSELWKSDGTTAGTVMVKDIEPYLSPRGGGLGSEPTELTNVNGVVFFAASRFEDGTELWKTDGTDAGTVQVKDIAPGPASSQPAQLTNINGMLFFIACDAAGCELWKSDGTTAGTVRV